MILCCGEALIDMLPLQSVDGASGFVPLPGGAVFNTALALGRLGVATGFFGGLSADFFGDQIRQALTEAGVDRTLCLTSGRPATLAFLRLRMGQASYVFYDENSAMRMITAKDIPDIPERFTTLFLGGISLVGEPCGQAFETLMARQSGQQLTMLDPNIRTGFIVDEAAYRARLGRMIALADIVKFSDEDLFWLQGDTCDDAVREFLNTGPCAVIVTSGEAGARMFSDNGTIRVPARKVGVVDTVGAGDAFNAGLLAWLTEAGALTNRDALARLDEAHWRGGLEYAARAAAVSVSRSGANPPWKREM